MIAVTEKLEKETFPVLEMSCAACAVSVESILKSVEGVKNASVNFANQSAFIEFDPGVATPTVLQNAVRSIGYDLVVNVEDPEGVKEAADKKQYAELKQRTGWSIALAVPVIIMGMWFMDWAFAPYLSLVLTAPVVFYFGRSFFIHAWKQVRMGRANMDTLVALSTGVAFLFSVFNTIYPEFWHARGMHAHVYYEAAATVIAFISLGKLLEEKAKSNTSSAIKKLMGLQPKTVVVLVDGKGHEVPLSSVKAGDSIIVKPGERIAVDGVVVSGKSFVDESMISGEAMPVEKTDGLKVFAGTINQKGSFIFRAEKVGADTLLAHIIKMVQQAQGSKAPVQKLVDKVAGIFVPVVIVISILTFAAWMIVGGDNAFTHALLTSITVLVIACPCALGLATPTAIMVGVGRGAENNMLIKDAESVELAHRVNTIVLDKTGTITAGKPIVTDMVWTQDNHQADILLSLESRSEHPVAQAVVASLSQDGSRAETLEDFESLTGLGVRGTVGGRGYFAGNDRLIANFSIVVTPAIAETVNHLRHQAKTVVYFTDTEKVLAVVGVADQIKPTSKKAIEQLQSRDIEVIMLTGDNAETANAVAAQVGIKKFRAGFLPSDKAEYIRSLQHEGKTVAMVGDGINDSEALAQADVSIAMGKGSDIAMDVAKMTLITSDLQSLPKALTLSGKTVRTIRQNLFWAFIYNLIGIPIAAGVLYPINGFLLDPMLAGAAMALSSVSVVSNSLRLKFAKI